jgi:hypothetical protein
MDIDWMLIRRAVIGIAAVALTGAAAGVEPTELPAQQEMRFVCAQVILAIDASGSTRERAFHRQVGALQSAFRSPRLPGAIQDCLPGSVAFAATTWSGAAEQDLCLDWSVVMTGADGHRIAERLADCRYFGGTTDIGRALDHGLRKLEKSPFISFYRIVFILTNGRTDRDAEAVLARARARASAAGVTLAAHALLRDPPDRSNPFFVADALGLEAYVADHVTAGPRAFTAHSRPGSDVERVLDALVEMLRQEAS